jgi:hypothetical protein
LTRRFDVAAYDTTAHTAQSRRGRHLVTEGAA